MRFNFSVEQGFAKKVNKLSPCDVFAYMRGAVQLPFSTQDKSTMLKTYSALNDECFLF